MGIFSKKGQKKQQNGEFRTRRHGNAAPRSSKETMFSTGSQAFRRSSVLTGTTSERIKASAEERGQLQTARLEAQTIRRKQKRVQRKVLVVLTLAGAAFVLWANAISQYGILYTDDVKNQPNKSQYQQTATEFSQAHLAARFSLSLSAGQLESYLQQKHPEIASVAVKHPPFSKQPVLRISFRQPVLIWQTSKSPQPYFVDSSGKAFAQNVYSNNDSLVKVDDQSGIPAELGNAVVSSRQIGFLGQLVGQVAAQTNKEIRITKITFPQSSTKEVDVNFNDRAYFAKVYLDRSPVEQASEIVASLRYFQQKQFTPSQYLDVRVKDRVFYK